LSFFAKAPGFDFVFSLSSDSGFGWLSLLAFSQASFSKVIRILLLPKRRDDYKLDFGLIKTLPLSNIGIVLELRQTFNKSSVDIFSYRETVCNFSLKL
tara:strand:+ start:2471 stop:2764 length:294 start_codon:yes stop_codon:yes gene_type:complete